MSSRPDTPARRPCRRPPSIIWLWARRGFGATASRGASPRPANGSHVSTAPASAEEFIAAIGFEPRHTHSRRHLYPLQNLSRLGIDPPHIALLTLPGAVPQLAVRPGDSGDDAVRFDGAKDRPCFGIDLMDLPAPMLPYP